MNLLLDGWKRILMFSKWKKKTKTIEKFPCKECLVKPMCTAACDKIIMDEKVLMEKFLEYEGCPDCGSKEFIEGPSGGMAQNIKCADCGHWFNVALPLFIQRIRITTHGRFRE